MLIVGIIFGMVAVLERHTLVSMFIVTMLIMVITFPLYWLFQTCVQESKIASMRFVLHIVIITSNNSSQKKKKKKNREAQFVQKK